MANTNSTPKGTSANRKGANQKKQKIINEKKSNLQQRQQRHNINPGAKKDVKVPTSKKIELSIEDIISKRFEELAVAIAYAKNETEKKQAVQDFATSFNDVPAEQRDAVKAMIAERLKENDFIYGSEFIDLTGLRQYQDEMFKVPEISLEDRINNRFEEMAVSVAYAKNEAEKLNAVRKFGDSFNQEVPAEQRDAVKAMIAERLKEDDFIYGSEFIDLTGLRQYQDKMFEPRKVAKEFEPHSSTLDNKQPESKRVLPGSPRRIESIYYEPEQKKEKPLTRPNPNRKQEQDLYQALVDGINNEEIKNIKGYSKDDLKKIIDYHNNLLDADNGNGTAFESLYENSISDLKKFADGNMQVDNDSYETMLEFIKIFGTNSKGQLTPEGKAAYDKLMGLMADAQKDKILKNKEDYQKQTEVENSDKNKVIGGIIKDNTNSEDAPDFAIGVEDKDNANTHTQDNKAPKEPEKKDKTPIIPILPIIPTNDGGNNNSNDGGNGGNNHPIIPTTPDNNNKNKTNDDSKKVVAPIIPIKPEKKSLWGRFKDWGKRNWKKIVGAAALIGGLLLLKDCSGDQKIAPKPDDGNGNKPDTTVVVKPDTIALDANDLSNGFYLERSAGFKAEQAKINFNDAEVANKADILTIKKLVAHKEIQMDKFVRHETSKNKEPINLVEVAYKMRLVVQNFPKSKMAQSVNNLFSGKVSDDDRKNVYAAFNHIDDFGNLLNKKGQVIEGIPGKKTIDPVRQGPGSKEYGTEGTANNFMEVLKNQRTNLK